MVAGNVGVDDRLGYTGYGDVVDLAARLEQMNKTYDAQVSMAESVAQQL